MYDKKLISVAQNLRKTTIWSIRRIAEVMNISKSTIGRWLCEKDTPKQLKKRGRPSISLNVLSLFPKHQFSSLKTIISTENLQFSATTLSRRLREMNITKKKVYH